MAFLKTLTRLVTETETRGKSQLSESLRSFADHIVEALQGEWADFELSALTPDADDAGEAAMWLDAVACTKKFGLGKAQEHADIELDRLTAGDIAQQVKELFESKKLPPKGLVYVAWSESPSDELSGLDFSYVGFAASYKKLDFSAKSPLAKAVKQSKTLSLIVPALAKPKDLEALASSIIHLSRAATDEDPTFNDDVDAAMEDSSAWKKLDQLSDLLEQAGVHLNNRARTGED